MPVTSGDNMQKDNFRIESLMSARLFMSPQRVGEEIYFVSNLSGHNSLYKMKWGGSVPQPLLPPQIALQNPVLMGGEPFAVFPKLEKIIVMIDRDGDENYLPMEIPLEGGYPKHAFNGFFKENRCYLGSEVEDDKAIIVADSRKEQMQDTYLGDLKSGEVKLLAKSKYGYSPTCHSDDYSKFILLQGYSAGDTVMFLWENDELHTLYGKPMEERDVGEEVQLTGFGSTEFVNGDESVLFKTAIFSDTYSLAVMDLDRPGDMREVSFKGAVHQGKGEFVYHKHLRKDKYLIKFNIDGISWLYIGKYDHEKGRMKLKYVLSGEGELSKGVVENIRYEKRSKGFALGFSSATTPSQIYTVEKDGTLERHTDERILGIPEDYLSPGEDFPFESFDGLRVSARLYMPSEKLGYQGKRPLVYYIHGGPQGQEKPDFTWFSMPLIQFMTLNGFAVFVPNVRGSSGYGLDYMKRVDRDWGGKDRLDHVHAMKEVLPKDDRIDTNRAGVVGRSYGGYMTLVQAFRHPDLWSAAIDMFGPYDLVSFSDRIPPTWKPYFKIAIGDPAIPQDRERLLEMSPKTYQNELGCPLLVIQGRNDPRVVAQESIDLVENLKGQGKEVDIHVFENEGHDVLKFENRVTVYNMIRDFFSKHLGSE